MHNEIDRYPFLNIILLTKNGAIFPDMKRNKRSTEE
jgi:hypothetical protein